MTMRRFSLMDALILVAGLALGLRAIRETGFPYSLMRPGKRPSQHFFFITMWLGMMGVQLAPAVLLIRLRRPRPPMVEVARQPGFVACAAVLMANLYTWIQEGPRLLHPYSDVRSELAQIATGPRLDAGASAVLMAWLALALAAGWRPERSWVDRLGRGLGLFLALLYGVLVAGSYVLAILA